MEYDVLNELAKLADKLDDSGFAKHADEIDGFITKFADDSKTAMLSRIMQLASQQMEPEDQAALNEYIQLNKDTLSGQQVETMLSQMSPVGPQE